MLVSMLGMMTKLFIFTAMVQASDPTGNRANQGTTLAAAGRVEFTKSVIPQFLALLPVYLATLVVVQVVLTIGLVLTVAEENDTVAGTFTKFYLIWMTFHGTTYGEVLPMATGSRVVCVAAMLANYLLYSFWVAAATLRGA